MFHFEFLVTFTIYNIPKLIINKHVFQINIIFLKNRSRVFQISNDINRSINHRWQHSVPTNKYFINAVKYNYFLIWQQNFSKNNSIRALTLLKRESLHRYNIKIAISIRGMKHLPAHCTRGGSIWMQVSFDQDRPVISRLMNGRQRASW